jgi:hypothetical protein
VLDPQHAERLISAAPTSALFVEGDDRRHAEHQTGRERDSIREANRPVRAEDGEHPEDQDALSRWAGAMASVSATAHAATKTAAANASFEGKGSPSWP